MATTIQTVAVVEDDSGMRSALERVLLLAGFSVDAFVSAEAYLVACGAARADCLVCDVSLPGISGFELRRRLVQAGSMAPIIFITAHDSPGTRDEAQRLGATGYLPKPFEGSTLVGIVRQATRTS
jgi:FixJ family two-component response regulator